MTKAALLGRRLRYSTVREDEGEKTTSRTPSTNRSAHDNGQVLAAAAKRNHAGPQTKGAPTPEGQVPAAELPLRSGTPLNRYILLLTLPPSTLITQLPLFHPSLRFPTHPAPPPPRLNRAQPGPLAPRNWPPVKPLPTVYAALAYYHANRSEIESESAAADALYEELSRQGTPSGDAS